MEAVTDDMANVRRGLIEDLGVDPEQIKEIKDADF